MHKTKIKARGVKKPKAVAESRAAAREKPRLKKQERVTLKMWVQKLQRLIKVYGSLPINSLFIGFEKKFDGRQ